MLVAVDGLRVKASRKAIGISQAECAKRAEISKKTLQLFESSRYEEPKTIKYATPRTITAVADTLGVDKRLLARPKGRRDRLILLKAS